MRLFTAVELPPPVREAVWTAAGPVLAPFAGARAVPAENLHVTLRFLGEVSEPSLPALTRALSAAAAAVPGGTLRASGFGAFPSPSRPRVVWAGIDDPAGLLAALERSVTAAISPLGFPPEERAFTAHVTVARIDDGGGRRRRRGRADRQRRGPSPLTLPPPASLGPAFPLRELTLFRSDFPGGRAAPVYTPLERHPLSPS